jgi:NADPH2:quinone reductase
MKAAIFKSLGPAEQVLETVDIEKPVVAHGEVLVRIKCSAVNPSDVKKRSGAFPDLLDDGFIIPHSDASGVIEAVGHGVPSSRIGERVWLYNAQYLRRFGTAAEYVSVPSNFAAHLPDEAGFDEGSCVGIPAMTAHRCTFADGSVDGKTILITGGAGRVGHYAIQMAKQAGATVIATAGSLEAEEHCYTAGADIVCPHQGLEMTSTVMEQTQGQGVDRVIEGEFGANLPHILKVVRTGATIATYSSVQVANPAIPFKQMMFMDLSIRMVLMYAMPEPAKLEAITAINNYLKQGKLQHRIAHHLPLDEIVRSHQLIEQKGFYGAVVLDVG